jgi:hypothetical protein
MSPIYILSLSSHLPHPLQQGDAKATARPRPSPNQKGGGEFRGEKYIYI